MTSTADFTDIINNTQGVRAEFTAQTLQAEDLPHLIEALLANTTLLEIDLEGEFLTDAAVKPLLEALQDHPTLKELVLASGKLTDAIAPDIATLLTKNPRIATLQTANNNLTENGIVTILEGAAQGGGLVDFAAFNNRMTEQAAPVILQALQEFQPRNLTELDLGLASPDPELYAIIEEIYNILTANAEIAHDYGQQMVCKPQKDWSSELVSEVGGRLPCIRSRFSPDRFKSLLNRICDLPYAKLGDVTTPDRYGFTALDNPVTWQKLEKIQNNGTPITRELLLENLNKDGEPFICNGIRNGELGTILNVLHANNESIEISDLLEGNSTPSPVLKAIIDSGQLHHIMTPEFWAGKDLSLFKPVLHAIPNEQRDLLPHQHSLFAAIGRMQRAQQRSSLNI